jgi:hypothetical protein
LPLNSISITKDFNGLPIVFREDGYINMTKAAKHFGKKLSHFWDSPQTKEYIEALSQMPGFRGIKLVITSRGRYGETWVHPKMAVFFARWLDVRFAVWCDLVIGFARSYCVAQHPPQEHSDSRCGAHEGGHALSYSLYDTACKLLIYLYNIGIKQLHSASLRVYLSCPHTTHRSPSMELALNTFELAIHRNSLFIEVGKFCLFASFWAPKGSPRWEASRHEAGRGVRLIAGPLMIDANV